MTMAVHDGHRSRLKERFTAYGLDNLNAKKAKFKESADKIWRMYESASANGFTSFAEA